jgi:hypothetical protein
MLRWLLGGERNSESVPSAAAEVVEGQPHSAEVYRDAARHFLDVQITTMANLDTKLTQYLSVASLALPVAVALLNFGAPQHKPIPTAIRWMLLAALAAYIAVPIFAGLASRIRALDYRPDIPTLKEHSEEISGIFLTQWVANEYERSITENKRVLQQKARLIGWEALAFYAEGPCLSLSAVFMVLL